MFRVSLRLFFADCLIFKSWPNNEVYQTFYSIRLSFNRHLCLKRQRQSFRRIEIRLRTRQNRFRRRKSQPTSRYGGTDHIPAKTAQRFVRRAQQSKSLVGRRATVPRSKEVINRHVSARHVQRIRSDTRG